MKKIRLRNLHAAIGLPRPVPHLDFRLSSNITLTEAAFKGSSPTLPAHPAAAGTGVIWKIRALDAAVIPAKAGIHAASLLKWVIYGLDSRLRGNDRCFGSGPLLNEANLRPRVYTQIELLC